MCPHNPGAALSVGNRQGNAPLGASGSVPSAAPPSRASHVRAAIPQWRRIGASHKILNWLAEGVRVSWGAQGPPPPFFQGVSHFTRAERAFLSLEAERCCATGAWRPASRLTHVTRAFLVYARNKPRLVLDLRHLNSFVVSSPCRMEGLPALRRMLRRHDWMFSVDIADAYHIISFHEEDVHYFSFGIETLQGTRFFETPVLNFGYTNSPAIFTEVMAAVVDHLRHPAHSSRSRSYGKTISHKDAPQGLRVLPWLDDFLFILPGALEYSHALRIRDEVHALFASLHVSLNEKGVFNPTHVMEDHLGFTIDATRALFLLTPRRVRALTHGAHSLLRTRHRVQARQLAAFCGLGEASGLALPLARFMFMLRALYDDLASKRSWSACVALSRQSVADLRWWAQLKDSPHVGRAIWRPPQTRELWTDASSLGWGGTVAQRFNLAPAAGFWTPDEFPLHITLKELVAVRLSVQHFLPVLTGHRILLHEDNQAIVWCLTNWVSRSPVLMRELRALWLLLDTNDIYLHPQYIRSADNAIADEASRLAASGDYALRRRHFEHIMRTWFWCTVDAFASPATAQLPRYWSRAPTAGAEATDAFTQSWEAERLWLHPPPALLPTVLQLLGESDAEAIVLAPLWASASWFGALYDLAAESLQFPPGALVRIAADAPPSLERWPVVAFLISPHGTR